MRSAFSPLLREDTFLGACHGIADDFGFDPLWLRILFAGALFWSPPAAIGAYLAAALLVILSRGLVPEPASDQAERAEQQELPRELELPLAA